LNHRTKSFLGLFKPVAQPAPLSAPASFSAFYERTHLSLFRYLYGFTGGPQEDVEDLTAEAFSRAWRARRTFQGDEPASLGWLIKIARRLAIDDYRRRKARPVIAGDIPDEMPISGPLPEDLAMAGEDQQILWSLLRGLPDEPREILVLRYLLGWQVNQIAACLELPENSVSVTIHRTLERLRQQWPQRNDKEKE
jgi:RNA polymerase sigma-70 factor (ECF subfamily)